MLYHYTYEYGWVDGDQALHIYHSRDGQIGLSIRTERIDSSTFVSGLDSMIAPRTRL